MSSRSVMYIRMRMGLRTVPLGTPLMIYLVKCLGIVEIHYIRFGIFQEVVQDFVIVLK